jgi:hypothetical protein
MDLDDLFRCTGHSGMWAGLSQLPAKVSSMQHRIASVRNTYITAFNFDWLTTRPLHFAGICFSKHD